MKPPTLEEVQAYFRERGTWIDPEQFWAHYEANGWTQGRGRPLKSWKAAVITWEKNEFGQKKKKEAEIERRNGHQSKPLTIDQRRFELIRRFGIAEACDWSDEEIESRHRKLTGQILTV